MRFCLAAAVVLVTCACVSAQTPSAPPAAQAPAFDSNRAFAHLEQLVEIGPRPAGSPGIQKTRDYIKQQLSAVGLTPTEQAFEARTPIGTVPMVNISATIPGPGTRRLIFAGTTTRSGSRNSGSSARTTPARACRFCWSWRAC